jgi:hypothetical protein
MDAYTSEKSNLQVSKISGREFAGLRAAFATAVSGRTIARSDWTKSQKAARAAQTVLGEATLDDLTREQICKIFGVSRAYLTKALALSSATREAVGCGHVPLSDIPTVVTDKVLRKTICDAGVARTWGVLEPLI